MFYNADVFVETDERSQYDASLKKYSITCKVSVLFCLASDQQGITSVSYVRGLRPSTCVKVSAKHYHKT